MGQGRKMGQVIQNIFPLEGPAEDVLRVAGGGPGLVPASLAVVSSGGETGEVESLVDLRSGLTLGGLVLNESDLILEALGSLLGLLNRWE